MKKFLAIIMLFSAVLSLRADDRAELKKICNDYHQFIINGTFDRIVPLIHPAYKHTDPDGKTLDYGKVKQLSAIYRSWQHASRPEASLADIMEFAMLVQGKEYNSAMRSEFDAIENTEQGKELKASIRMMISAASFKLKVERMKMAKAWKTFKLISIDVKGNNARVVYEMQNTESPKTERSEWDMVKTNGKWLIKKSVTRHI